MTALAGAAGAQTRARGASPGRAPGTPSVRDAVWPLAPAPMVVCLLRLLAPAAIVPVVTMRHDEYRYDSSANHDLILHCDRLACPCCHHTCSDHAP